MLNWSLPSRTPFLLVWWQPYFSRINAFHLAVFPNDNGRTGLFSALDDRPSRLTKRGLHKLP